MRPARAFVSVAVLAAVAIAPGHCADEDARPSAAHRLPAWLVGKPAGWIPIPSANASKVVGVAAAPGVGGMEGNAFVAWQGASLDTRTSRQYFGPPGGHFDGSWNGVLMLDWTQDAPQFERVGPVSTDANRPQDTSGFNPDGLPSASHTYSSLHFIEARDRHLRINASGTWGDGQHGGNDFASFDVVKRAWDPPGALGTLAGWPIYPDSTQVKVAHEDVFVQQGRSLAIWRQATAKVEHLPDVRWTAAGARGAYDARRDRVLVVARAQGDPPGAYLIDGRTFAQARFPLAGVDETKPPWGDHGFGIVFVPDANDPTKDRFLLTNSWLNGTVWSIDAATGATRIAYTNTTGVAIPDASGGQGVGLYGKFVYVPALGGVGWVGTTGAGQVWFLKL